MIPRQHIGKTYVAKRADQLKLRDEVLVYQISTGMYAPEFVVGVELVGDDVIVHGFRGELFTTSIGNSVLVEVR